MQKPVENTEEERNMAKTKQAKPMMPTVYFYNAEGEKKYIYGRFELETIVNAIYKDLTEVYVRKHNVSILNQVKTDEIWEVEINDVLENG